MKTLIIPDIHGKPDLFRSMLDEHKDADRIVQLGDLANCVYRDRDGDLECLEIAYQLQQRGNYTQLVGNHEHPYLHPHAPRFGGFGPIPEVREAINKLTWEAATMVGGLDYLVTHAGLHPAYYATEDSNVSWTAGLLNIKWGMDASSSVFSDISGARGGYDLYGGILWRDHSEPLDTRIKQIYGHTKGDKVRQVGDSFCIDCEQPYIVTT